MAFAVKDVMSDVQRPEPAQNLQMNLHAASGPSYGVRLSADLLRRPTDWERGGNKLARGLWPRTTKQVAHEGKTRYVDVGWA